MSSYHRLLIDGTEVDSENRLSVLDPYDGSTVADVALADASLMERAVSAAEKAQREYGELPVYRRVEMLEKIVQELRRRREELAALITAEAGKPTALARGEVERAINTFTLAVEEAKRIGGEVIPMDLLPDSHGRMGMTGRFPQGVIAAITPFNFPLNLVAHKVAPALAGGNTLVVKPSSQAPVSALLLGEIALEAGLPPGVLNVVPAAPGVAGGLVTDSRVRMVTFTGSDEVGWGVRSRAKGKKVLLELGGDAAAVVEPDGDLEFAASRIAAGGYAYAGQICISVQRIFVHEGVMPRFLDLFLDAVGRISVGDPKKSETLVGPMIEDEAADRVQSWVDEATSEGAVMLAGGEREGNVLHPVVLTGVKPSLRMGCREVFGPVTVVEEYRDFGEALERVNSSCFGLQAGVFTADLKKAFHAYRRLEVGGVIINDYPTYRIDHMPYGGVKNSGLGREGVRYAIEEMTEMRLLVLNLS